MSPTAAPRALVPSRYLLLADQPYRDRRGTRTWFGFATRTATVVPLSEPSMDALRSGDVTALDPAERDRLAGLGVLVEPGQDELATVTGRLSSGSGQRAVRAVTIMPTSYCNMACSYCGQEHFKAALDERKMDRTARRVTAMLADPTVSAVQVTWFGGEPLLALRVIRELSARFTAAADEHGKSYSARMATNGSLMTVKVLEELALRWRLRTMELTIDGPEAVHDARRLKRNGKGSFHRTVSVLGELLRRGLVPDLHVSVRMNIDQDNEAYVPDLINDLACFGLASRQVSLHLIAVHSWGNDVSAVELAARSYAEREAGWLRLAETLGIAFTPLPPRPVTSTCVATTRSGEVIDSSGRVYSCSEHPLVPGAQDTQLVATVADLAGSAIRPAGAFDDWYDQVAAGGAQCSRCPVLPVCGGSCPKLWREGHLPCPSVKFNWRDRLDLAVRRQGYRPDTAIAVERSPAR